MKSTTLNFIEGYLIDVNVYLGKQTEHSPKEAQMGKTAVLTLCKKNFYSNRCVCADNFFRSIPLCDCGEMELNCGEMELNSSER